MKELNIYRFSKATVLPYKRDPKGTVGLGGVIDSDGNFVESSYCHGGRFEHGGVYDWNKSSLEQSNEKVIYFGYFLPHWGHFLIDCLGRMWPFAENGNEYDDYKIAYISQQSFFYENCYEYFHALGIERSRFIWIDTPTQFNEVLIPEMSYTPDPGRIFFPHYTKMYNKVIDNILAETSVNEVIKKLGKIDKVYFTRSHFNNAQSREVGLKIIDNVMRNGGYNIIAPEKLSLSEQIVIWNYAKHIICINGTIPLNVIFYRGHISNLLNNSPLPPPSKKQSTNRISQNMGYLCSRC